MLTIELVLAVSRLIAVLPWRPAGYFAKDKSKVALITKTDFLPDLGNGSIGSTKQCLSLCDALMVKIGNKWLPRHSSKEPCEMRFAHVDGSRGLLDRDHASQRVIYEIK